jgi:RNA polymerase sigma-70 factor (ECF subfamily)
MVNKPQRRSQLVLLADEALMFFADHGDKEALGTLYDRHSRTAYSLAYRMMGERQAAEDLVQEGVRQRVASGGEL